MYDLEPEIELKIKEATIGELTYYDQSGCSADVSCGEDCSDPNPSDCDP